ncbi:MAG: DNA repair protein RadA [Planctomycetota bacterium]|jgi:DNA repair protein RadA/Sms
MAKSRTTFLCRSCGGVQSRWLGKCPDCGAWDALEKFVEPAADTPPTAELAGAWSAESDDAGAAAAAGRATPLPSIRPPREQRLPSGIGELDRVLGGGFVAGSAVLLGGDPGIGKSTLLLQAAGQMAGAGRRILSRLRAERLFGRFGAEDGDPLENLFVLADTSLARIGEQARLIRPDLMIVDSIQMVHQSGLDAAPGSVAQLRRCCAELVQMAKVSGIAVVIVGHVTKDGQLAGPKLLEHLVDAVLGFEGDRYHAHRVVRGTKNRFGTTLEVGLFEMTAEGLREIDGAADVLAPDHDPRPGTVVCPVLQGSRAMLVELQALTAAGLLGSARRRTSGLDGNRLAVLLAVLEQHAGARLADQDVFCSTVGGLRVVEPASDLALCLAVAGAHRRQSVPAATAVVGEVGLGGEVRRVAQLESRIRESRRLGYRTVIAPDQDEAAAAPADVSIRRVTSVVAALEALAAPEGLVVGAPTAISGR